MRDKWLPLLRHEKVKFIFSGAMRQSVQAKPYSSTISVVPEKKRDITDDVESDVNTTKPSEMLADTEQVASDTESDTATDVSVDDDPDNLENYRSDDEDKKGVFSPNMKYNGPVEVVLDSVGYPSDGSHPPICFVGVTERDMAIESQ